MAVTKKNKSFDELPLAFPLRFPLLLQCPFFQLEATDGVYNMQLKNILYCEGNNAFTTFHTRTTKSFVVLKPVKHFERLFRNYGFKRVNQQVINLTYIVRFRNDGAELLGGERIAITPAMKKSLAEALTRFSLKEKSISKKRETINNDFIARDIPALTELVPDKLFYFRDSFRNARRLHTDARLHFKN